MHAHIHTHQHTYTYVYILHIKRLYASYTNALYILAK